MRHFIHSYWTKPRSEDYDYTLELLCAAYSVYRVHSIGGRISLHTDIKGKEIFKDIPYDDVKITLEDLHETISPHVWSASKFVALREEPADSIHIDNDVFVYDDEILNANLSADVVCQHAFRDDRVYPFCKYIVLNYSGLRDVIDETYIGTIYHYGLIQFRRCEIKDRVVNSFFRFAESFSKRAPEFLYDEFKDFCPNLFLEEELTTQILKDEIVGFVCNNWSVLNPTKPNGVYEHFAGKAKHKYRQYIEDCLEKADKELFDKITNNDKERDIQ